MSIIYSASSGESDDDLDGIPPLAGAGDNRTSEDSDADIMDLESNTNNDFNGRSLPCEIDMDDDNTPILENKSVGEYNLVRENSFVGEITLDPVQLNDNIAPYDELVHLASRDRSSSPDVEMEPTENGVKRKSAGSPKGKGKKTSNVALDRQAKKQKLAEENAAKKTAAEMNKIYRPGECLKYMNVEGHPSLWERWYMSNVPSEVSQLGAHVLQAHTLCYPALIVWTRNIPRTLDNEGGQVRLSPIRQPCDRALFVADAEELSEMVSSHTLSSHLSQIRKLCDCKLTLLVFNVTDYFKSPRRRTSNSNRTRMTEIEFELAITDLLVTADCDTVIANTASELASIIVQLTKAIAEAPTKKAKRACDDKAEFYMRGNNKNCVAVDKNGITSSPGGHGGAYGGGLPGLGAAPPWPRGGDGWRRPLGSGPHPGHGVGVGRLWQQMLAILPQSSLETSRALCAQYKSPLALYESLQSSGSIAQLADIGVSRTGVVGSRARRVGPEFARKLHTLFTATDVDQVIE